MLVDGSYDLSEGRAEPAPVTVVDNVVRFGDEWSVVRVELARLVGGTVVVRVTDWRHAAVRQAVDTTLHLEHAHHLVHHPLSMTPVPLPL